MNAYYKGAHGVIVTYDITDRDSFAKIQEWMHEIDKHAESNITRILVGNKKDMESERAVAYSEGKELADHFNIRFLETSAKESVNVEEAFTVMAREIKSLVEPSPNRRRFPEGTTQLTKSQGKKLNSKSGRCC